jgi:hypothetical protein
MERSRKLGRPPKPARLKRSRRLQLLLTKAEYDALNHYAERQQMTASEVMRGCLRTLLSAQPMKGGKI